MKAIHSVTIDIPSTNFQTQSTPIEIPSTDTLRSGRVLGFTVYMLSGNASAGTFRLNHSSSTGNISNKCDRLVQKTLTVLAGTGGAWALPNVEGQPYDVQTDGPIYMSLQTTDGTNDWTARVRVWLEREPHA